MATKESSAVPCLWLFARRSCSWMSQLLAWIPFLDELSIACCTRWTSRRSFWPLTGWMKQSSCVTRLLSWSMANSLSMALLVNWGRSMELATRSWLLKTHQYIKKKNRMPLTGLRRDTARLSLSLIVQRISIRETNHTRLILSSSSNLVIRRIKTLSNCPRFLMIYPHSCKWKESKNSPYQEPPWNKCLLSLLNTTCDITW